MQSAACDIDTPAANARQWRVAAEIALIFLVFFIQGAWPVPEVNEPHYLGKARHYWDPTWCPSDFFLNTADAHTLFYFTFGWLTLWMPLAAVAWVGRIVSWILLAWAWRRLSAALVDGWIYSVLSAALFVALNDRLHMAGEWVVVGVEAKSFAYVLVLLGLEALVRDRWGWSLVAFGAASAFHVVVGGWAVVAEAITWLTARRRPPLASLVLPAACGLALALVGLVPALALNWGADAQLVGEANRLYVYERLTHHLLPGQIPAVYIVRHLLLVAALVPLAWLAPADEPFRRLCGFVAAAVGIAAAGMALSLLVWWNADLAATLLRFYWFRLSDVMVPLGAALLAAGVLCRWQHQRKALFAVAFSAALLLAVLHYGETIWRRHTHLYAPAERGVADLDDWRAVCDWAAQETPRDALFLVPRMAHTFRWHSGRSEVVTRKDFPQDAASIVEWWRRLTEIYPADHTQPWRHASLAELGAQRLSELGEAYGADYVVTSPEPPVALERVGPLTRSVAVYALPRRERKEESGER